MKNSKNILFYIALLIRIFPISISMAEEPRLPYEELNPSHWLEEAEDFLNKGEFGQCINSLESYLALSSIQKEDQYHALLMRASAFQYLGSFQSAFADLKKANQIAKNIDSVKEITVMMRLGDLYLSVGKVEEALNIGKQAVQRARGFDDTGLLAVSLNNWGNALMVSRLYELPQKPADDLFLPPLDSEYLQIAKRGVKINSLARNSLGRRESTPVTSEQSVPDITVLYQESAELAKEIDDLPLAIRATINKTRAALTVNNDAEVKHSLLDCKELIKSLPQGFEKGFLQLSFGVLCRQVAALFPHYKTLDLKLFSWNAFTEAAEIAERIDNGFLQSYAKGYLGNLYENDNRIGEAITLTRSAIFFAQQESSPETLYRWQWQLARLLAKSETPEDAIAEYSNAINSLDKVRSVLTVGYRNVPEIFKNRIKPVYYELADLFLKQADQSSEASQKQAYFREARNTIEKMKSAELEDYFQEDCILSFKAKQTEIDRIVRGTNTAVVYPILRPDRLELLVSFPNELKRISVNVTDERLTRIVEEFRKLLEQRPLHQYLPQAEKLYDWLIRPIEADLTAATIDTLVFIPDGHLRTIPLSTLYDGERFLIEKYAVVTSPGFTLTDPKPLERRQSTTLLMGLSEEVPGFEKLPSVAEEVRQLADITGGKVLLNAAFTPEQVSKELKRESYRVIHMATHGIFDRDPEKTVLVTHNGNISLNQLERLIKYSKFRDEPLELLTLGACETAVGDERAALGLAGVAAKSGARSVVASLWQVSDEATKELITEFYRQYFENPQVSKAQALQISQKKLIAKSKFDHPCYWAPFLIIGNWL